MKGKVKQTIGGLRKSVRAAGVGFSTLAASFFMSVQAYAAGVEDSQIVTGTEQLIGDLTTWLMVLAPVVSGLLSRQVRLWHLYGKTGAGRAGGGWLHHQAGPV